MAFQIVQPFRKVEYSYDRAGDVLYISFGPPKPAVAIQVEDWLAVRMGLEPPFLAGMTIVGFKNIFKKINTYIEQELPERMERLTDISFEISYDDQTDIFIMRLVKKKPSTTRRKKPQASIFEPLVAKGNVYVEKSLPSKDVVGIKILEYTKCGPAAIEAFFGAIIDTLFEPHEKHDENAHLVTNAFIQRLDWKKLSELAA